MTRRYEIVYIFDSSLDEEQVNAHLARFRALLVSPEKAEPITGTSHWGKRALAYPIKRRDMGYYAVVQFETDPKLLAEFERAVKLEESVVRYLLVLNEGEGPRPVTVARPFGEGAEEESDAAEVEE
ncbi:MAG TPA: 30S ribosomal protein S6 [Candidatus Dormibacteraeota bacterium]|nr:30S ribosomal protein S6 [Candidatus Dormibacteraeota bacterium]